MLEPDSLILQSTQRLPYRQGVAINTIIGDYRWANSWGLRMALFPLRVRVCMVARPRLRSMQTYGRVEESRDVSRGVCILMRHAGSRDCGMVILRIADSGAGIQRETVRTWRGGGVWGTMSQSSTYRWNTSERPRRMMSPRRLFIRITKRSRTKFWAFCRLGPRKRLSLVDIGGGSGGLAERVLEQFAGAHVTVVDQSEPFLALAERRLARFAPRAAICAESVARRLGGRTEGITQRDREYVGDPSFRARGEACAVREVSCGAGTRAECLSMAMSIGRKAMRSFGRCSRSGRST